MTPFDALIRELGMLEPSDADMKALDVLFAAYVHWPYSKYLRALTEGELRGRLVLLTHDHPSNCADPKMESEWIRCELDRRIKGGGFCPEGWTTPFWKRA